MTGDRGVRPMSARPGEPRQPRMLHACVFPLSLAPDSRSLYSACRLSLNAFPITETELKLIAALAIMGLSSRPKNG